MDKEHLKCLTHDEGWEVQFEKPDNRLVRFAKGNIRIDVWYSVMTVGIYEYRKQATYERQVSEERLLELLTPKQ